VKKVLALALLGAIATFSAQAQDIPDPLRIATEGAYPPFNFIDDTGALKGFEVDLANELCARIKANCEIVSQEWDGIIPGLLAQRYDAIIASLYITDERREQIAFSDKYYQVPARFVAAADSTLEMTPAGLAGVAVGTQRGTGFERFLRAEMPDVDLRVYATMDEAYLDLATGRLDVVMGDVVALSDAFLKTPDGAGFAFRGDEFVDPAYFGFGAGVGVRKENAALADAFSKAIAEIRADGTYQRISEQWFGFDVYGG